MSGSDFTLRSLAAVQYLMYLHRGGGGPAMPRLERLEAYLIDRYNRDEPAPEKDS